MWKVLLLEILVIRRTYLLHGILFVNNVLSALQPRLERLLRLFSQLEIYVMDVINVSLMPITFNRVSDLISAFFLFFF